MLEDKDIELINRALDEKLDSQEQALLVDLLATNSEAQALHQDLTRIALLLQNAPKSALPWDIATKINTHLSRPVVLPGPSKQAKIAWAMAASLFIAAGMLYFGGNTGDEEDIVGSLVDVSNGISPYIRLEKEAEQDWSIIIDIRTTSEFRLVLDRKFPGWHLNSINIKGLVVAISDSHIEISGLGPLTTTLPLIGDQSIRGDSKPAINGVLAFDGKIFKGRLDLEKNK